MKTSIVYQRVKASRISYDLAQAAYALHAAVERELHGTLAELDLTIALADALWQLDPELGPLSRRELAERLHCDPSNVTFLVRRLEHRVLVERARVEADRRVNALALTPAGVDVRNRLIATLAGSPLFARLTRAEQGELAHLLTRCADEARGGPSSATRPAAGADARP